MPPCCVPGTLCQHHPQGMPIPKTYHKDLGFPEDLSSRLLPPLHLWLVYTPHAKREIRAEGVMPADLPVKLPTGYEVVEVEVCGDVIQKWVIRIIDWKTLMTWDKRHTTYDLVLAVLLDGTVKTVWLNAKGDTHRTLQRHRYTVPSTFYTPTPKR